MKRIAGLLFFFFPLSTAISQSAETLAIRSVRKQNEDRWLKEYLSFLSIPNVASDTAGLRRNASFIMQMMRQRGIANLQLLYPQTAGKAPAVYGELRVPGAKQTLIFYAHYDGQPVDPAQWSNGLSPFEPKLVKGALNKGAAITAFPADLSGIDPEWRVYARGASDDKAGVMAILSAYEAIVKSGRHPSYNIKFFFEGEEEAGSAHLGEIFEKYKDLLRSDLWVICDGPVHQSGKKTLLFGVRGDAHVEVTVYGPARPLHSGHYGNWAPNPGLMLARLLASMKDEKGRVTIPGFYDDTKPLNEAEKKAIAEMPPVDEQLKKELQFSKAEMPGIHLTEAIMLPSLNINGMQSGNIGSKASNVIPVSAAAVLDLRMVPGNDYRKQQEKVVNHIKAQGYHITGSEPAETERQLFPKIAMVKLSEGYNAQRTSMTLPVARRVIEAVKTTTADQVVLIPSMGGSLPLFLFEKHLKANTITVPIVNYDNNQHAENENLRLQNLWDGIETLAAVMLYMPAHDKQE